MNKILKNIIFSFFTLILLLPFIQDQFKLIEFSPLEGVQVKIEKPELNKASWLSSKFQEEFVKYIEENVSFRPWLIRFRNQIRYTLFSGTSANKIVIGKEGYLYEQDYIDAYLGKDFIGENALKERLEQIETLQNVLKEQGKDLILVILPGKATFYPEFLPNKYNVIKNDSTNYKSYCKLIKNYKINNIDFLKYFLDKKEKSPYPLIPKCGIHWSYYGMSLAVDSMIKYVEYFKNIDLPDLEIEGYNSSDCPKDPDYDLGNLLNIMFPIKQSLLYYPIYKISTSNSSVKPKLLTIGDSFYWNLNNDSIPQRLFDNPHFWYYNSSIYPESFNSPLTVSEINVKAEIEKQDIILIMITEFGLGNIGYGFIETANNALNNNTNNNVNFTPSEELVQTYIIRIKSDPDWMKDIERKAKEKNITIEDQLRIDADWLLRQENSGLNDRIQYYINEIKSDPEWLSSIKIKAKEKNLQIEEMVLRDATWMAENENP